jgi:hypothetical protein
LGLALQSWALVILGWVWYLGSLDKAGDLAFLLSPAGRMTGWEAVAICVTTGIFWQELFRVCGAAVPVCTRCFPW